MDLRHLRLLAVLSLQTLRPLPLPLQALLAPVLQLF